MIKIYNGLDEAENYEVNLNRICRGLGFKNFISQRHNICPNGLTISCCYSKANNCLVFHPEIKYYGYDSISNNGTAYSDLGDYTVGPMISNEMINTILEYIKLYEPELYSIIENNIYK